MSAVVTLASFTVIVPVSETANSTVAPLRVSRGPGAIDELGYFPPRTWYRRMPLSCSAFSGRRRKSTYSCVMAANASFVGAVHVEGVYTYKA